MQYLLRHYSSKKNLLELTERGGFIKHVYPREKVKDVKTYLDTPRTVYAGFDPTANSLHIGNLMVIMALLQADKAGHKVIAVVGGATATIGDPSGHISERPALNRGQVAKNASKITKSLESISGGKFEVLNNLDWYKDLNVLDFLATCGKHCRLGKMLAREAVKARLEAARADPNGGMSLAEFTYQAFQAYDWLHLADKYDCLVQIGGSDQLGNIAAGHDLIKRASGRDAYGLVLPLITSESGNKLGKTSGTPVWLSPGRTSEFDMYQFLMRLPDDQVEKMLLYFTLLPRSKIDSVLEKHRNAPEKRLAQSTLATHVTEIVHGQKGLQLAENTTDILYKGQADKLATMSSDDLKSVMGQAAYTRLLFTPGMSILDLAMKVGCFHNEADAQRIIAAGGFWVNQLKRANTEQIVMIGDHILPNNLSLVRVGKKNYYIVEWTL